MNSVNMSPSYEEALEIVCRLSMKDRRRLFYDVMNENISSENIESYLTSKRFAGGRSCPYCGKEHVRRNGHRHDGTQRYLCLDCKKTFGITTNSIIFGSHKQLSVWQKYFSCMMNKRTLRRTAELCGISLNTAFVWRHKILGALKNMADEVILDGIVEADETFLGISYSGNHTKSHLFVMPRRSRVRGGSIQKRGLSKEQVCIVTAVNREGKAIARVANIGKLRNIDLGNVLNDRIAPGSYLCTDGLSAYRSFATNNGLNHIPIKGGKAKRGIYHIQNINQYHGQLKKFIIMTFCGVPLFESERFRSYFSIAS